jgi:hypothetical protein
MAEDSKSYGVLVALFIAFIVGVFLYFLFIGAMP